jgi:hypothetical protein
VFASWSACVFRSTVGTATMEQGPRSPRSKPRKTRKRDNGIEILAPHSNSPDLLGNRVDSLMLMVRPLHSHMRKDPHADRPSSSVEESRNAWRAIKAQLQPQQDTPIPLS